MAQDPAAHLCKRRPRAGSPRPPPRLGLGLLRCPGLAGGCTARADYYSGAAGNIGMPLHPAEPPKASLSCIRDLSSNNKGNGQEIRDK